MSAHALIHTACKDLGLDEDTRRDLYERVTGKRSLTQMSAAEHERVVSELRAKGFKAVQRRASGKQKLTGKYAGKLQALWIAGYNLGLVKSRDDMALLSFIKRQTGIDHSRFLRDGEDAAKVIEALKAWLARDGGVEWRICSNGETSDKKLEGHKIAAAQHRLLCRDPNFHIDVTGITGKPAWQMTKESDWIAVMNAFGEKVRASRRASGAPQHEGVS
jgi:Protein of unknown function (DUF1018)